MGYTTKVTFLGTLHKSHSRAPYINRIFGHLWAPRTMIMPLWGNPFKFLKEQLFISYRRKFETLDSHSVKSEGNQLVTLKPWSEEQKNPHSCQVQSGRLLLIVRTSWSIPLPVGNGIDQLMVNTIPAWSRIKVHAPPYQMWRQGLCAVNVLDLENGVWRWLCSWRP